MQGVAWVASFRVGVALLALLVLPVRYPSLVPYRALLAAYLVWATIMLALVWRRVGGELRPLVGGIVDQLLLTFVIHEVGSTTTMLSAMYLLSGTMNALVVSFRVGVTLAVFGSALFAGMLAAEQLGWIAYAPAAPEWLIAHPPTPAQAFASGTLAASILLMSTLIVGRLVAQLEELSQRDALTQLYNTSLAKTVRTTDVPARFGGDEFVVLLPDTEPDDAMVAAERVAEALADVGRRFDSHRSVTASVGVAIALVNDNVAAVLHRADESQYGAKRGGGNRVVLAG